MTYSINKINAVIGNGSVIQAASMIDHIIIDSRKVYFPESSLFFALKSPHQDGHHFIDDLYKKGVRNFVVSQPIDTTHFHDANFIPVKNTLDSLQQLAAFHRHRFTYPVIGITGSNGKTIVKEWLFQLLNNDFDIVRSPKSYNSQVGVPLAAWEMNDTHDLAILEAGISQPAEMDKLQSIIDPEMGIFTFLGDAHAEGFENKQQKISEKLLLFKKAKILFYCADEEELDTAIRDFKENINPSIQLFTWSKKKAATFKINEVQYHKNGTTITGSFQNYSNSLFIPFTDEASVHNAITCIAVLFYFEIDFKYIEDRLQLLKPVEMRLELKEGTNGCSIINDSYSADINSLAIAIDFLIQQQQQQKRTVILSDLLESGQTGEALFENIAAILNSKKLYRFIGIGLQMKKYATLFSTIEQTRFYDTTDEFIAAIPSLHFFDESILLKGARVFQFEKISKALEKKLHQTVLEIDLNALRHNVKFYRQQLKPSVKLMCMVKAFSYGSGTYEIAGLLQHAGVDYLGVAYADEGVELRKAGIHLPIMVMNAEEAGFDNMVKYNLEPELYAVKILQSFKNYLLQHNISHYPVHIKIDTGMRRLGFEPNQVNDLCKIVKETNCFKIQSVFSHLAAAADPLQEIFTQNQAALLLSASAAIEKAVGYSFYKHISNTTAISRHPDLQLDMVRLGIGMYGIEADKNLQQHLKNVTTLKTTISQIKHIAMGETVGYDRSETAKKDTTIATVRIGYADGYPRILSNGVGYMLVNNQPAPVMGRICMDMTMLDITGIEAKEEDEVIVFGTNLPVSKLANWAQTIEYEILTNISQRVRRVYYEM